MAKEAKTIKWGRRWAHWGAESQRGSCTFALFSPSPSSFPKWEKESLNKKLKKLKDIKILIGFHFFSSFFQSKYNQPVIVSRQQWRITRPIRIAPLRLLLLLLIILILSLSPSLQLLPVPCHRILPYWGGLIFSSAITILCRSVA